MKQRQFLNRLLSLYNIDGDLLPELDGEEWEKFRDNPVQFFIRHASDDQQAAIWREIEARQSENRLGSSYSQPDPRRML